MDLHIGSKRLWISISNSLSSSGNECKKYFCLLSHTWLSNYNKKYECFELLEINNELLTKSWVSRFELWNECIIFFDIRKCLRIHKILKLFETQFRTWHFIQRLENSWRNSFQHQWSSQHSTIFQRNIQVFPHLLRS